MLYRLCRYFFVLVIAYPVTLVWLGLAVRQREHLPQNGPALVIANHNSHLDFLVLQTLFPLNLVPKLRTAAAADYFFRTPLMRFIAHWFLGLVPVERGLSSPSPAGHKAPKESGHLAEKVDNLSESTRKKRGNAMMESMRSLAAVLREGDILLLFPEGTRAVTPESMTTCKAGVWHLAKECPEAAVHPVYLHGLGRSMPKGFWVPVPFFIDICAGEPLRFSEDKRQYMLDVQNAFMQLRGKTIAAITQKELHP